MQKVVTYDENIDIRLPVVLRGVIKLLRDDQSFVENSSTNISKDSVATMLSELEIQSVDSILVFYALEIALQIREEDYENVTVATRQECKLTEELASDMDCNYFYLSDCTERETVKEEKFDFVILCPYITVTDSSVGFAISEWLDLARVGESRLSRRGKLLLLFPSSSMDTKPVLEQILANFEQLVIDHIPLKREIADQWEEFKDCVTYDLYVAKQL